MQDAWAGLGPSVDLQMSGTYMMNPPLDSIYLDVDDIIGAIHWNGFSPSPTGQHIKVYDGMENTLYNFERRTILCKPNGRS